MSFNEYLTERMGAIKVVEDKIVEFLSSEEKNIKIMIGRIIFLWK